MKSSSILMSSFAALLMLISVHENSLIRNDFESKPEYTVTKVQPIAEINVIPSTPPAPSISKNTTDFSYLKFNISDFKTTETGNNDMPEEADFAFLKFNVTDFIETETEIVLLPESSDFNFLKFDVNNYTSSSYDEELPLTDLSFLKFDVQKYTLNDSVTEINELPEL